MLEDAQAALVSTQFEKARHEARCQAATRNLEEVQRRSDRDKNRWDEERKRLEVELERCRAKLSVATEKVNNQERAKEDSMRALPSPSSGTRGQGGAPASWRKGVHFSGVAATARACTRRRGPGTGRRRIGRGDVQDGDAVVLMMSTSAATGRGCGTAAPGS